MNPVCHLLAKRSNCVCVDLMIRKVLELESHLKPLRETELTTNKKRVGGILTTQNYDPCLRFIGNNYLPFVIIA